MPPTCATGSRTLPPSTSEQRAARAAVLLLAAATLAGCGEPPPIRETLLVFGSEAQIELRGVAPARAQAAIAAAADDLQRMHRDWHPWEPGALTDFNTALAGGVAIAAPDPLREPLARARALAAASDSLLNPAIGQLVALWGFHTSEFPITQPAPEPAELLAWRSDVPDIADLEPLADGRLRSRHPRLQLDLTAIAEGFAAAALLQRLRESGIRHALVMLGGDVVALGDAGGRPWQVGVRDPFGASGAVFAGVELHDGEALFSSGSYARYRETPVGGRWPHVLDPRSGLPVRGVAAVSVLHDDPVLADAAATALMVAGPARLAEIAARLGVACVMLLTEDDTLLLSEAMQARLRLLREPTRRAPPLPPAGPCSEAAARVD
jgi:FAD:protein FMN transferase